MGGRYSIFAESGVEVKFINISLGAVYVVLCLFVSANQKPYLSSGAGAALSLEDAMAKAYNEAEFMFISWRNMKYNSIDPDMVKTVKDHGRVYIDPKNHVELDWLLSSKEGELSTHADASFEQVLEDVNPCIVEIARPTDEIPLWVIRAFSQSLIPIHFGYGAEHDVAKRLEELGLENKRTFPSFPHFFS